MTKEQEATSKPLFSLALIKYVGYWRLSDGSPTTSFGVGKKPTDEQIANTEKLLGWKWEDEK